MLKDRTPGENIPGGFLRLLGMRKFELLERLAEAESEIARLKARDTSTIRHPSDAGSRLYEICNGEQERFGVLYLDARQRVLTARVVHVGSLADVSVHPREVFRDAIRMAAHAVIVGHNHPSQDPTPSVADLDLTRRLVEAGKLLGVPVLDHLVLSDFGHTSIAKERPDLF